jgi:DNA-binding MarR family transcriptional regulator
VLNFFEGGHINEKKLERAIELMMHTRHYHKNLFESKLRATGLYGTQHRILMHLACKCKLQSQKELAEHLQITPAAITGAIKKLEADGYIARTLGHDNRFNEIEITEKGRVVVEKSKEIFRTTDRLAFDGFSDEELDMYIRCLEKLETNIKNHQSKYMEGNQ